MKYPEYVARVKELLEKIEWAGVSCGKECCPSCETFEYEDDDIHASDCELDLLRKEVPE